MGIKDYENSKIPMKTRTDNKSFLDVCRDSEMTKLRLAMFGVWVGGVGQRPEGKVINRHCFRYTKLREEIFFIKCDLFGKDIINETNIDCSGEAVIIVNETSFWNRFNVFKSSNIHERFTKKDGYSVADMIHLMETNDPIIGRITINILTHETNEIHSALFNDISLVKKCGLVDKAVCKVTDSMHYNKRMWLALFKDKEGNNFTYVKETDNLNIHVTIDMDDYKNPESFTFYDANPNRDQSVNKFAFALPLYNI